MKRILILITLFFTSLSLYATTPTAITLTAVSSGTKVTLSAQISPVARPGQVVFCETSHVSTCTVSGPNVLYIGQVSATGLASYTYFPGVGQHNYTAFFRGTAAYGASQSSVVPVTIGSSLNATATTLTASATSPYTLTSTVAGYGPAITGTVKFMDGATQLGSVTLDPATSVSTMAQVPSSLSATGVGKMTTGHFHSNGFVDVAQLVPSQSAVYILNGNGDGTLTQGSIIPAISNPIDLAVGDFNGDGNQDLVVVNASSIKILWGDGNGNFSVDIDTYPDTNITAVAVGDVNGDGRPDIVVTSALGGLDVFLNNGTTTLATQASIGIRANSVGLVLGDFNKDGILDAAVVDTGTEKVTILLGYGNGNFREIGAYPVGTQPRTVVVSDLNNDGNPDLVVGDTNMYTVLLGDGTGHFTSQTFTLTDTAPVVAVADLNNDGNQDLAIVMTHSRFVTLMGDGTGHFTQSSLSLPASINASAGISAADFNGDGIPDVLITNSPTNISSIYMNTVTTSAVITNLQIAGTGTHNVTAQYSGDSNYAASTSSAIPLQATKVQPVLSVAVDTTTKTIGDYAYITAQLGTGIVNVSSTNGETITLTSNGNPLGTAVLNNGTATFTTVARPVGTYAIQASYSGDSLLLPSTGTTSYTVNKATINLALTSSTNPSTVGSNVTFTSNMRTDATGTVTFTNGATTLCTVTLATSSQVVCASNSLPQGNNTITATYSGDSTYAAATATLVQVVNPVTAPSDFTISLAQTTGSTYTVTVSPANGAFSSPVVLTVNGCPTCATYSLTPTSVTPGSSPTTATLTITRQQTASTQDYSVAKYALCLLFLPLLGIRRFRSLTCILAIGCALTLSGCGGKTSSGGTNNGGTNNGGTSTPCTGTISVTGISGTTTHTSNTVTLSL